MAEGLLELLRSGPTWVRPFANLTGAGLALLVWAAYFREAWRTRRAVLGWLVLPALVLLVAYMAFLVWLNVGLSAGRFDYESTTYLAALEAARWSAWIGTGVPALFGYVGLVRRWRAERETLELQQQLHARLRELAGEASRPDR